MRSLMVRAIRVVVLILALLVALDKFGFQIAPLVAAIGVAGVGVGFAFQGVLGNIVAVVMKNFADDSPVGNNHTRQIELYQRCREEFDRDHLSMNTEQLDILSNPIGFSKNN